MQRIHVAIKDCSIRYASELASSLRKCDGVERRTLHQNESISNVYALNRVCIRWPTPSVELSPGLAVSSRGWPAPETRTMTLRGGGASDELSQKKLEDRVV